MHDLLRSLGVNEPSGWSWRSGDERNTTVISKPVTRRRRWPLVVGGILGMLGSAAGGYLLGRRDDEPQQPEPPEWLLDVKKRMEQEQMQERLRSLREWLLENAPHDAEPDER